MTPSYILQIISSVDFLVVLLRLFFRYTDILYFQIVKNFSLFLDGFCFENPFLFRDSYKRFVYITVFLYAQNSYYNLTILFIFVRLVMTSPPSSLPLVSSVFSLFLLA